MARSTRNEDWQGMNWIRQEKRLALYLLNGMSCVWCRKSVEDGITLSLDHVIPHVNGGTNHESNLVCACTTCNSSRGDRPAEAFAAVVADYVNNNFTAADILNDIARRTSTDLKPFRAEAKNLIARRGSAARAVAA
jgi:hypothetical protein